jgi:hypothetical protein
VIPNDDETIFQMAIRYSNRILELESALNEIMTVTYDQNVRAIAKGCFRGYSQSDRDDKHETE